MNVEFLIILFIVLLVVILGFLVIAILNTKSKKTKIESVAQKEEMDYFEEWKKIVKNPNSSSTELLDILKRFNQTKILTEENLKEYLVFLSKILSHKNANVDIFRYFHKEIKVKNQMFLDELEMIEMKALSKTEE